MTTPHPLFPADDDGDVPSVGYIHVTRHGAQGQQWCARLFAASELSDLAAVHELFGGGLYELIARDPSNKKIVARVRYSLEGRARPLNPEPTPEPTAQQPQQQQSTDLLPLMLQWMQAQQSAAAEAGRQQTQLMLAMMADAKATSAAHVEAMGRLHAEFAKSQSELLGRVATGAKEAGGGTETFIKGIEFAQELAAGAAEARAEPDDNTLETLLEGAKLFAGGSAPPAPPPNGGGPK